MPVTVVDSEEVARGGGCCQWPVILKVCASAHSRHGTRRSDRRHGRSTVSDGDVVVRRNRRGADGTLGIDGAHAHRLPGDWGWQCQLGEGCGATAVNCVRWRGRSFHAQPHAIWRVKAIAEHDCCRAQMDVAHWQRKLDTVLVVRGGSGERSDVSFKLTMRGLGRNARARASWRSGNPPSHAQPICARTWLPAPTARLRNAVMLCKHGS